MITLIFLLLCTGLILFQIRIGTVFAGGNRLKRSEYPGPFWFIIGIEILGAVMLTIVGLSQEGWLGKD